MLFWELFDIANLILIYHTSREMLELCKAAQSAPCIRTRVTQKRFSVVVGGDPLLRVWSTNLLTWCMLQRGVKLTRCLYQECHQETSKAHPLTVICYYYLLLHMGTSGTARSSLKYLGLQSTGSGKGLRRIGNFSSVLLFKGKGSEWASWICQINNWLQDWYHSQEFDYFRPWDCHWEIWSAGGCWSPSVREGQEHLQPWVLN